MGKIKFRLPCRCQNGHFNFLYYEVCNGEIINRKWDEARMCKCRKSDIGDGYDPCGDDEQFIGLLDKNGKEIYEGDIVRTFNYGASVVEYLCGGFGYLPDVCSMFVYFGHNYHFEWLDGKSEKIEVIGNIHENREKEC